MYRKKILWQIFYTQFEILIHIYRLSDSSFVRTAKRQYRKLETKIFPEYELIGLSPNSYTFMFLWAIYIFPGSVCLFCCRKIYRSLADTWMWKLGLRPAQFLFWEYINRNYFALHTDKKENQIFLIYREIQSGAVAKSYMTNGLLIYGEIFLHFLIY